MTKLKVEKAQVESSLREEEAKCGMLLKEVKDANEVKKLSFVLRPFRWRHFVPPCCDVIMPYLYFKKLGVATKPKAFLRKIHESRPTQIILVFIRNKFYCSEFLPTVFFHSWAGLFETRQLYAKNIRWHGS